MRNDSIYFCLRINKHSILSVIISWNAWWSRWLSFERKQSEGCGRLLCGIEQMGPRTWTCWKAWLSSGTLNLKIYDYIIFIVSNRVNDGEDDVDESNFRIPFACLSPFSSLLFHLSPPPFSPLLLVFSLPPSCSLPLIFHNFYITHFLSWSHRWKGC